MKIEIENLIHKITGELNNIKNQLQEQKNMITMLMPEEASVSFIASSTGKSRQAIHSYLVHNFLFEDDYYLKGGRTFVTQKTAIQLLMRYKGGYHAA